MEDETMKPRADSDCNIENDGGAALSAALALGIDSASVAAGAEVSTSGSDLSSLSEYEAKWGFTYDELQSATKVVSRLFSNPQLFVGDKYLAESRLYTMITRDRKTKRENRDTYRQIMSEEKSRREKAQRQQDLETIRKTAMKRERDDALNALLLPPPPTEEGEGGDEGGPLMITLERRVDGNLGTPVDVATTVAARATPSHEGSTGDEVWQLLPAFEAMFLLHRHNVTEAKIAETHATAPRPREGDKRPSRNSGSAHDAMWLTSIVFQHQPHTFGTQMANPLFDVLLASSAATNEEHLLTALSCGKQSLLAAKYRVWVALRRLTRTRQTSSHDCVSASTAFGGDSGTGARTNLSEAEDSDHANRVAGGDNDEDEVSSLHLLVPSWSAVSKDCAQTVGTTKTSVLRSLCGLRQWATRSVGSPHDAGRDLVGDDHSGLLLLHCATPLPVVLLERLFDAATTPALSAVAASLLAALAGENEEEAHPSFACSDTTVAAFFSKCWVRLHAALDLAIASMLYPLVYESLKSLPLPSSRSRPVQDSEWRSWMTALQGPLAFFAEPPLEPPVADPVTGDAAVEFDDDVEEGGASADRPPLMQFVVRAQRARAFGRRSSCGGEASGSATADAEGDKGEDSWAMNRTQKCHTCKGRYRLLHPFYYSLCRPCGTFNMSKRYMTRDLRGKVVLMTGCRIKIGYAMSISLLRCGATLLGTTRFAHDAVARFAQEPDYDVWKQRLHLFSLDLRDMWMVTQFCGFVASKYPKLFAIINNAAQTIARTPEYTAALRRTELHPPPALREKLAADREEGEAWYRFFWRHSSVTVGLPLEMQHHPEEHPCPFLLTESASTTPTTAGGGGGAGLASAAEAFPPPPPSSSGGRTATVAAVVVPTMVQPHDRFIYDRYDTQAEAMDLREKNSWTMNLHEVQGSEAAEVMSINALSPFILNSKLKPLLMNRDGEEEQQPRGGGFPEGRFIINVSAMEGQFYRFKQTTHPHTNMAKAALNMMTRTSAEDYAASHIYMNSVDTGWITDESPVHKKQRRADGFMLCPLDEVDAAARCLDLIYSDSREYGKFWKDFHVIAW